MFENLETKISLTKTFIEFGAHDGIDCSNTRNLLINGWSGVYIEADKRRFKELCANTSGLPCLNIRSFVTTEGRNHLEQILQNNDALESDYDLLSIDIDGNDYWILDSLKSLRPKVIVIEYNSTIPLGVEFTQPKNSQVNFGSSAESLMHLANSKGYDLCYMTSSNLFFVRKDVSTLLTSPHFQFRNQIHRIWQNPPSPIYLFSAIDGTVLISDNLFLNWHRVLVKQNDLQKLPRFLRKPTGDYNLFLMMIFRLRYKLKTDLGRFFRNHLSPKNFEMLKRVFTEKIDAFLQNLQ